jgi:hypothetical protein
MRVALLVATLVTVCAVSANAAPGGNDGTFPGKGKGVGAPGKNGTPGTFASGGATNGDFPGEANSPTTAGVGGGTVV